MNGKGSDPRPLSVSREEFARDWDAAFGRHVCRISGSFKYVRSSESTTGVAMAGRCECGKEAREAAPQEDIDASWGVRQSRADRGLRQMRNEFLFGDEP